MSEELERAAILARRKKQREAYRKKTSTPEGRAEYNARMLANYYKQHEKRKEYSRVYQRSAKSLKYQREYYAKMTPEQRERRRRAAREQYAKRSREQMDERNRRDRERRQDGQS
jgi:hypothetical protein